MSYPIIPLMLHCDCFAQVFFRKHSVRPHVSICRCSILYSYNRVFFTKGVWYIWHESLANQEDFITPHNSTDGEIFQWRPTIIDLMTLNSKVLILVYLVILGKEIMVDKVVGEVEAKPDVDLSVEVEVRPISSLLSTLRWFFQHLSHLCNRIFDKVEQLYNILLNSFHTPPSLTTYVFHMNFYLKKIWIQLSPCIIV